MQDNIIMDAVLTEEERVEKYIGYLKDKGYIVIQKNSLSSTTITTAGKLVEYFYSCLQYRHPERRIHYNASKKRDVSIASRFIKSRMESGVSKKEAIKECVAIIDCVLENEMFILNTAVTSIGILGQDVMKWVTDKAISIINRENKEYAAHLQIVYEYLLYEKHEEEALKNLPERAEELKDMRRNLINGSRKKS